MRNFSSYFLIFAKGAGMGAADVIPGVSGGTIAFLTGIYQEFIDSIKSIDGEALKLLFKLKLGKFWKHINGNFLFALALGILTSFFSLAKLMKYLMANQPIPLWSFFFGLIIISAILILKDLDFKKAGNIFGLVCGICAGVAICLLSPAETPDSLWFILLCGAIAICAMILPGISGSFILLLLGKYEYMLTAISELKLGIIAIFAIGAIIGLTSFSRLLSWLLKRYYNLTISILAGIMIGSLVKVWPWQHQLDGSISRPVLPDSSVLDTLHGGHIPEAVIFAAAGIALVLILELTAKKMRKRQDNQ